MRMVSYLSPGFPASLFETFAELVGAELTLIEDLSGPAPGTDPFADETFDLGWICSTSFVDLSLRSQSVRLSGVAWAPIDPDANGQPVYFGDLVVPEHATARTLTDLVGRRVGCNDPVSLSGHYALRFALHDLGVEPDSFLRMEFTGGHNTSLDRVIAGSLDAAIVDSVVLAARRRNDPSAASLRTLQRLGPWPVQPLVVRSTLPQGEVDRIRTGLLRASDDPLVQRVLNDAMIDRLVPTDDDHYSVVRAAMVQLER